jgi:nicotinate-nucleotide adenylyltransferase
MVRLACEGEEGLEASDIENHEAKSYTIQTLERLRNEYREPWEFYFVIGADAFAEVGLWYRVPEVLRMTRFIVVGRPGYEYPVPEGAQVVRLDGLELPVSATGIRARLAAGEAVDAEVPARVLQYIRGNNLYRKAAAAC